MFGFKKKVDPVQAKYGLSIDDMTREIRELTKVNKRLADRIARMEPKQSGDE